MGVEQKGNYLAFPLTILYFNFSSALKFIACLHLWALNIVLTSLFLHFSESRNSGREDHSGRSAIMDLLNRQRYPIKWENSHLSEICTSCYCQIFAFWRRKLSQSFYCFILMSAYTLNKFFTVSMYPLAKCIFFSQKRRVEVFSDLHICGRDLLCKNQQCKTRRGQAESSVELWTESTDFRERLALHCCLPAKSDQCYLVSGKGRNTYIYFC